MIPEDIKAKIDKIANVSPSIRYIVFPSKIILKASLLNELRIIITIDKIQLAVKNNFALSCDIIFRICNPTNQNIQ